MGSELVSGYIYRGIGTLRKMTPQGEVQARNGDLILTLPGGLYVMDETSAVALVSNVSTLEEILGPDAKPVDPTKSQRELEDLSSSTHPAAPPSAVPNIKKTPTAAGATSAAASTASTTRK